MDKGFVHYCCVSKGGRILHSYNDRNSNSCESDVEIENLAALCLENVPQNHKWYSQTMNKRTYSYLMEDGFVYFAISEIGIGNRTIIRFLEHYRDEFKRIAKRNSGSKLSWKGKRKGTMSNSNLNSVNLHEQLVPVIRELITSLQNVRQSGNNSVNGNESNSSLSPFGGSYGNSTKAPLLGSKSGRQEKRSKDHVIAMRGIESQEQCKSSEKGLRDDSGGSVSRGTLQKEINTSRRLSSQSVGRKWCRLVQLVLAIDAVVCIGLLVVWLMICNGIQCIS